MEVIDLIETYLDEEQLDELEPAPRPKRPRRMRPRPDYFTLLDDVDFRDRFRLKKPSVVLVHDLIKTEISTTTMRNEAVPTMKRLLITLRYLATGSFLIVNGDFGGVSQATTCRIVESVTEAIAKLRPQFIKFPENKDRLTEEFYQVSRFPPVIGAIGCAHVDIISPGGPTAENFRNRNRKTFSIKVQVISDSRLRIQNIVARWPGASHNQTVFNNSYIKFRLENGEFGNGILLGDSGYENKNYLLTPILNPNGPIENLYNEAQIRTRNVVERCFGVLKNRFPVLKKKITLSLSRTQATIVACAVLHNIAIQENEDDFGTHVDELTPAEINARRQIAEENKARAGDARRHIIKDYFAPLYRQ